MDRINSLEKEIANIRKILHEKEKELYALKKEWCPVQLKTNGQLSQVPSDSFNHHIGNNGHVQCDRLPKWAIERYSRQILLPDIGVSGQEKLCAAKVLIVGAGGLGCPAAMYLAGAGVGEIGIVDYDTVDLTNIHRQTLHGESDQNMNKVDSAADALRSINSKITITPYKVQLDSTNALAIASKYDILLDCTDNVPTRYMLSDVSVLTKLPLVSGSALKMEGQISLFGYRAERNSKVENTTYIGPCYRCVFPTPPPAEAVGSCSANGVAGPVPGVVGALQALEAIKYIVGQSRHKLLVERMVLFDGEDMTFRTVKLRPQNPECAACSKTPTITHLLDYETFCKAQAKEKRKQDSRLNAQRRRIERERRMTGQSYYGFRISKPGGKRKWIQDVPKSERKIGPPCKSKVCAKGTNRFCSEFTPEIRQEIFNHFWKLDWKGKKKFVRALVDSVTPKRRRAKHIGEVSRKGDSKLYHLTLGEERLAVCRVMFLSTLGVKEATVRSWLVKGDVPKTPKKPVISLNVVSYIESLPKAFPKCEYCRTTTSLQYVDMDHIKNVYQLYHQYMKDMKLKGVNPACRKTFVNVFNSRNIRIFKPKNDTDICDVVSQHNLVPNESYQLPVETELQLDKEALVQNDIDVTAVNYYYNNPQWT